MKRGRDEDFLGRGDIVFEGIEIVSGRVGWEEVLGNLFVWDLG